MALCGRLQSSLIVPLDFGDALLTNAVPRAPQLYCSAMLVFENMSNKTVLFTVIGLSIFTVSCNRNKYEVVERNQREVPNFMVAGTHDEVHYVLLHDGHKIYTTCDVSDVSNLDPDARCGFRPLRTYECVLGNVSAEKGTGPLSDLKCTDDDGHNVYLYVEKKE